MIIAAFLAVILLVFGHQMMQGLLHPIRKFRTDPFITLNRRFTGPLRTFSELDVH